MTDLSKAKVIKEEKLKDGSSLVMLDLAANPNGIVFPAFAVYVRRGAEYLFVSGRNKQAALYEDFTNFLKKYGTEVLTNSKS